MSSPGAQNADLPILGRPIIGVSPPACVARHARLFALLEQAFPVSFQPRPAGRTSFGDANLVIGHECATVVATSDPGRPCLAVPDGAPSRVSRQRNDITFGTFDAVPPALRGAIVTELHAPVTTRALRCTESDGVVAARGRDPVWIVRRDDRGSRALDLVSAPLPTIADDGFLCDSFGRDDFMSLLPVIELVQRAMVMHGWQPPPLRACIVFDDVNIRGRSYGCLDFHDLVDHSRRHNFHAALAIIPLDAARARDSVADLLRDNHEYLSLIVHGNNHQPLELARPRPGEESLRLVTQARQRIRTFCDRHCLPFSAVMEPPYGTILADYFEPLDQAGYDAVLVTPRQFRCYNDAAPSHGAIGIASAEVVAGGLSMIPRITADTGWRTDACLAAFLGQPIVIAGHHFDADNELRSVDDVARFINAFGSVAWMSPAGIARARVMLRRTNEKLHIRCLGRHVQVTIPDGVCEVVIERPWVTGAPERLICEGAECATAVSLDCTRESPVMPVRPGARLDVRSPRSNRVESASATALPTSSRLRARRTITEYLDRAYPWLPRMLRRKSTID